MASLLLVGDLFLQSGEGFRGEVIAGEAVCSDFEGAGALCGGRGSVLGRWRAGHGGMLDVDEAGADFGKGSVRRGAHSRAGRSAAGVLVVLVGVRFVLEDGAQVTDGG